MVSTVVVDRELAFVFKSLLCILSCDSFNNFLCEQLPTTATAKKARRVKRESKVTVATLATPVRLD